MKKLLFVLIAFFAVGMVSAQNLNPVSWSFTSKKLSDNVYEIRMIASIQKRMAPLFTVSA